MRALRGLANAVDRFIDEHADRHHMRRQLRDDLGGTIHGHRAWAPGPEHEPECRGTLLDRVQRIAHAGDAAHLDEHGGHWWRTSAPINLRIAPAGFGSVMTRSPIRKAR